MSASLRGAATWGIRLAGVLILLCVALAVATALLLPALLSGDRASGLIRGAARDATGSELQWTSLDLSLFPPALEIVGMEARAEALGPEPWLSAERVELHIAWLPLLARTVLVDSLSLEGLSLSMRRDAEGWVFPGAVATPETGGAPESERDRGATGAERKFSVALRSLAVVDGSLRVDDRSGATPHQIELSEIRARLVASVPANPIDLSLQGELGGGAIDLEGTLRPERDFALEIRFRDVAMETAQPYLQDALALAGRASGTATLRGNAERLERIDLVLASEDAAVASEELSASGPLELELSVEEIEPLSGIFSFDATDAVLVYEVMFQKPAGVEARAGGRFRTRSDGSLDIDFETVRLRDLGARGSLRSGPVPTVALATEPFELEGWATLLPALSPLEGLQGRVTFPEFEISLPKGQPGGSGTRPQLEGRALLDGLRFLLPGSGEVLQLNGELGANRDRLEGKGLLADFRGHRIPVDLRVDDLFGTPKATIAGALTDVDANAFVTAFADKPDTLFGTLSLDADLALPLGGEVGVEALRGTLALDVEPGRLRGVSLFQSTIDSIGPLAQAALLAGQAYGGSTLQRIFDDEFTSLRGSFDLADGRARTDNLTFLYRDYRIDLKGGVGLVSGELDLHGVMTLFEEVETGAATDAERKVRRVLPLASVRGTVDAPRVSIAPEVALALATRSRFGEGDGQKSRLEEKIDERLGEGSGQEILNALESLLGNGKRR